MIETPGLKHHVVPLEQVGPISVYVQGDVEKQRDGVVYLTIHDVGKSYMSMVNFTLHESMKEVRNRSMFLHVAIPGQEPGANDLSADYKFPTCAEIGLNLVSILDQMRIQRVVGVGDGAGANILTRFGMCHSSRVHGIITINNTASATATQGFMDMLKDRVLAMKKEGHSTLNEKNVSRFADTYKKRTDILPEINKRINFDVLLITGMKSHRAPQADVIQKAMTPGLSSVIKFDDVTEPISEAPEKTAEALLLFSQGVGLLPTLGRRTSTDVNRKNSMSMQEYDQPNIRRLSLTTAS